MTDTICKVCGHHADSHHFATPVVCESCPGQVCQDGPDGERYRNIANPTGRAPIRPPSRNWEKLTEPPTDDIDTEAAGDPSPSRLGRTIPRDPGRPMSLDDLRDLEQ